MAIALEIGGVDYIAYLRKGSLTATTSGYRETGPMSFTLEGAPADIPVTAEMAVLFHDGATTYYGGITKTAAPTSESSAGWRVLDVECQDFTVLAGMDVIDASVDVTGLTDKQVITAAFAAHGTKSVVVGTECQTLATSLPADFDARGLTLAGFMNKVCAITGGTWYIDYSRHLHYFVTESENAPFGLSDSPDDVTTFGYNGFSLPEDAIDLKNAVYYIPGEGGDAYPTWYTDPVSIAEVAARFGDDGRREASLRDNRITVQATLDAYGAAFLAANGKKRTGSLKTAKAGLRGGMTVAITNADEGLSAEPFRVVSVDLSYEGNLPIYSVRVGDLDATLGGVIAESAVDAVDVLPQIDAALTNAVARDFANGIVRVQIVNSLPTDFDLFPAGSLVVLTTDRKLYTSTGSAWEHRVDGAAIIADTIIAAALAVGAVNARALAADALTIHTSGEGALAISIVDADDAEIASWDSTDGIIIRDPDNLTTRWIQLAAGTMRLTTDGGATYSLVVTPDGIDAGSVNRGLGKGAPNIVDNSNFERAPFLTSSTLTVTSSAEFTAVQTGIDNATNSGGSLSVTAW